MSLRTSLAAASLLALAACGTGTYNPGIEPVHQPVVERIDYTLDVRASGGGLGDEETLRVADWFETLELGYGDRVSIDDPSPYGNAEARDAIAGQAARYGLLLSDSAPVTTGAVGEGLLRVVVSRQTASVPDCPDWSRPSQPEFGNSTMSNYGCASATNLAAMVANPEDLIRGQQGALDSRVNERAIRVYRAKVPTGAGALKTESTEER